MYHKITEIRVNFIFIFRSNQDLCESDEDSLESSSDDECLFPNAANQDGGSLKEG